MRIAILIVGILAGLSNLYVADGGLNKLLKRGSASEPGNKFGVILGYVAAGWMFSWAIFEGLFPLIGGK